MRVIIDRIEGDIAVVEYGEELLHLPLRITDGAREGDTLEIKNLGRLPLEGEEPPHEIFERLRKKSRGHNLAKSRKKHADTPVKHDLSDIPDIPDQET